MRQRFSVIFHFTIQFLCSERIARVLLPCSLALFELVIFWHQSGWNPNGIHDGFMYAAAIRVAEGGVPNNDAFTQYGPYVMLVHGFWLSITDLTLISLRHLNALLLTSIGILLYFASKRYLSNISSVLVSIIWVLSASKLLPAVLPWPSVLSTLLSLISVFIFLVKSDSRNKLHSWLLPAFSGFLISLAVMVRIHTILLPILLTIFYIFRPTIRNQVMKLNHWFIGFTIGIALNLIYFTFTKSFTQYWAQCIAWAFNRFALNPEPWSHQRIIALLSSGIILILGFVGLLGMKMELNRSGSRISRKQRLGRNFYYISCIFLAALAIARPNIDPGRSSFYNPRFVLLWISENFLQLSTYMLLVLCLFYYVKILSKKIPPPKTIDNFYLFALGIMALSQLYPSPDQVHLWWISPLLFVLFLKNLGDKGKLILNSKRFCAIALILIISLLFQLQIERQKQSYSFKNSSFLGMTSSDKTAPGVDQTMSLLQKIVEPRSMGVLCEQGIYAASGKKYLPYNSFFLQTNGLFNSEKFAGKHLFACNLRGQDLKDFVATPGFHVYFLVRLSDGTSNVLLQRN